MIKNIGAIIAGIFLGMSAIFIYGTATEMYKEGSCMDKAQTITEVIKCDMKYGEEL